MNVLRLFVQSMLLLGLPALAGVLIGWARVSRVRLTRPICGGCGAPLSFETAALDAPCPQCQRPRSDAGDPRPDRGPRRTAFMVIGVLLLASSVGLIAFAERIFSYVSTSGMTVGPPQRPTSVILSTALQQNQALSFELGNLVQREADGEDVVGMATSQLKAALDSGAPLFRPTGSNAPEVAAIALLGLPGGKPAPAPDPTLAERCLKACFPPLQIDTAAPRYSVRPSYTGFAAPNGMLQRIAVVRRLLVDGAEVRATPDRVPSEDVQLLFAMDRPMTLTETLGPGEHTIEIELELRLYARFDADRTLDHRGYLRAVADWPAPLATATETVKATVPAIGAQP